MNRLSISFALILAMPAVALADITVVFNDLVLTGGNYTWTYTVSLKGGSTLNTGDYFTIYDIGGFGLGGLVFLPASWGSSTNLLGTNGYRQAPPDSSGAYNITYTYVGPTIVATSDTVLGGAGAFGYLSAHQSSYTGTFSATSHITGPGALEGNTSTLFVAGPAPQSPLATLDIDGDGTVDALTDGLLVIRYLLGLRGSALTQSATHAGGTRPTAADIETYIQGLTQ